MVSARNQFSLIRAPFRRVVILDRKSHDAMYVVCQKIIKCRSSVTSFVMLRAIAVHKLSVKTLHERYYKALWKFLQCEQELPFRLNLLRKNAGKL